MDEGNCLFCSKQVRQGLRIFSVMLCAECEAMLLRTSPAEPGYLAFVEKLKTIWPDDLAKVTS